MKKIALSSALLSLAIFSAAAADGSSPLPVNLGTAGNFTALGETLVSAGTTVSVVGNVGIYPAAATYLTGFSPTADPSNQFSTSALVRGRLYAADYASPTPAFLDSAIGDMDAAYTDAAGRAAGASNLVLTGSSVLAPGVYAWTSGLDIASSITLAGGANDVWIFQISGTLTLGSGVQINLAGGAQASNIFWQVSGQTTLGSTVIFNGNILDQTTVVLGTNATLNGKALAQAAVNLDSGSTAISSSNGYTGPNPPGSDRTFAYPSPAMGGNINVVYTMASQGTAHVRIYNAVGNLVASADDLELSGVQQSVISVNGFAPGVYLYKVVLNYDSGGSQSLAVQKFGVK
jgi:hypothetical protein